MEMEMEMETRVSRRQNVEIPESDIIDDSISLDTRWFFHGLATPLSTTVNDKASATEEPIRQGVSALNSQPLDKEASRCPLELIQTFTSQRNQTKRHESECAKRSTEINEQSRHGSTLDLEHDDACASPKTSQELVPPKTDPESPGHQQPNSLELHQDPPQGSNAAMEDEEGKLDTVIVADWLANVVGHWAEDPVPCFSSNPRVHRQDIDPSSGKLLGAVDYPETYLAPPGAEDPSLVWKKQNMTAALAMNQDHQDRESVATVPNQQYEREEALTHATKVVAEWPRTDCVLRPVEPMHFSQIAEIIHLEAGQKLCPQVLESKVVQERDIRRMSDVCQNNLRPFVVACLEEADFLDRALWPPGSDEQFLEFARFKQSQPKKPPLVVGFAFVTEPRIGLLNSPCPGSRFAGQIQLVVHPEHRNKLYGSALLDRILRSVAPYHRSLVDYEWKCDNADMIYDESSAALNRRQYTQVYIENLTSGSTDPQQELKKHILDKFDFKKAGCLHRAVRTDKGRDSTWLDLEMWQLTTHATIVDDPPNEYLTRSW